MSFRFVIFDLDGTLLSTLDDIRDSLNHTLALYGLRLQTSDEVRAHVGNGSGRLVELSIPDGAANPLFADLLRDYNAWYTAHCRIKTRPYDGVEALVDELRESGIQCAIVSNKPDAAVKSLAADLFPGRMAVAVGDSRDVRRKPAPDTVLKALAQLGAEKCDAVYVGDSEVDIATAANAGLPCISVTWGFRTREQLIAAGAKALADTADEVKALIR